MKLLKKTSPAAAIAIAAAALQISAAFAAEYFIPKYSDFNSNDVNGEIVLEIHEGIIADVLITFDSPEITGAEYYHEKIAAPGKYVLEMEGRDTTADDFRNYELVISFNGVDAPYRDKINIPDGNDHPDSYAEYTYTFAVDKEFTGEPWTVSSSNGGTKKDITVHLSSYVLGDVDGNGSINSSDASAVLHEYSALSTGGKTTLTAAQAKAADVNCDSSINASDASGILKFYSINSTGGKADWEEVFKK